MKKQRIIRCLSALLCLCLLAGFAPAAMADSNVSDWAKSEVAEMEALGLLPDCLLNADLSANITRGEMCKMAVEVYENLMNVEASCASGARYFTDTQEMEINFAFEQGIINGYADGTFRPTGTLSGNAFMKMLLGALGYDSSIEGYTGANWSIAVAKQAINAGLNKSLKGSFNGVKAVTREEACLYAFNTLKATMVEYEKNSTVTVGNITIKDTSDAKEMTNTAKTDGNIDKDGKMQFAEKYFTDLRLNDNATDPFMRPANQWKIKSEEIGTYAQTPDLTYTADVKSSAIY